MKKGTRARALDALLTLVGQNTFNYDALVNLLVEKGIITDHEISDATERLYLDERTISPAEWAWRCINLEDHEALNQFFGE